ncbi:MAG: hypothetical protein KDA94_11830 [Acidimicrobiales bacterium]|nr:hypothetical protein [Acidimicrobiales bacterium]
MWIALALVALSAILCGTLIAGSPVNGDDSRAARVAGINLTTPPAARAMSSATSALAAVPTVGALIVAMLFLATTVSLLPRRSTSDRTPHLVDLARARSRRGPPALV